MATDPKKPSTTPDANTSNASDAAPTSPAAGTPSAAGAPNGTSKPSTPPPGAGPAGSTSAPRPTTSSPAFGDPTVDRLSLDPADSDDWVTRTKLWVEANPVLALAGAVGLGLLVGRVVTAAIPDPEPKTLQGKIEKRARELSERGQYYADDAGDAIARQLHVASDALKEASNAVSKNAKKGYGEAKDFSESIAEAIGEAFSKKASELIDRIS